MLDNFLLSVLSLVVEMMVQGEGGAGVAEYDEGMSGQLVPVLPWTWSLCFANYTLTGTSHHNRWPTPGP